MPKGTDVQTQPQKIGAAGEFKFRSILCLISKEFSHISSTFGGLGGARDAPVGPSYATESLSADFFGDERLLVD